MDKIELGLILSGRIARGKCFICGKHISKERTKENIIIGHSKFGILEIHRIHIKLLNKEE